MGESIILRLCKLVIFGGSFELIPKLYESPCTSIISLIGRDSNICITKLQILMENVCSIFSTALFNLKQTLETKLHIKYIIRHIHAEQMLVKREQLKEKKFHNK